MSLARQDSGLPPACSLIQYLDQSARPYELIAHPTSRVWQHKANFCKIPLENLVRAIIIEAGSGLMLVVLSSQKLLVLEDLSEALKLPCKVPGGVQHPIKDLDVDAYPPLSQFLHLPCVFDESALAHEVLYFCAGQHSHLIKMQVTDIKALNDSMQIANFAAPLPTLQLSQAGDPNFVSIRLKKRLSETHTLPLMPPQVDEILRLRIDPNAGAADLARVIEQDPSLSAQLLSWASSPMYGYSERVTSIMDVIVRVMGFDLVMNLALSVALTQNLKIRKQGTLGLHNFWRQALYMASMMDQLLSQIAPHRQPPRGLCYLSGLLFNFGFLVMGLFLPRQYDLLEEAILANPNVPYCILEEQILGFNHAELGAWLMQAWHLPTELLSVTRWHHQADYQGPHEVYVHLVRIAMSLLQGLGIVENEPELDPLSLKTVGLSAAQCQMALDILSAKRPELDVLVASLQGPSHAA